MIQGRITFDEKILAGKPIIKGTRITVSLILELLSSGMKIEDILNEYPQLKKEDILSAVKYAAMSIEDEEFIPLRAKAI
jgi:uncharacterized protein (DUF433 family)